ncbi:protein phyllopod isoform X1 [Drosophila tropicalis]|uniref:protein phyllopod isoform X1 n=1 Tax=Drosophila tropicalis TaxID=46794 RepID=UPI0035AB8F1C
MSADNHAEPAAAMSAASAAAASSEYLKRTCLICGCHTNQTINIYEPRSGPNIVQLIQAKFKFQPLNEDKFLCFSCNNWLINWHSLQHSCSNSNDAESQSHSPSHMGNSSAGGLVQERPRGGGGVAKVRPVAQVRPQIRQQQQQVRSSNQNPLNVPMTAISYSKRRSSNKLWEKVNWSPKSKTLQPRPRTCVMPRTRQDKVMSVAQGTVAAAGALVKDSFPVNQRWAKPTVDGKVVAMFRRLGTTLSRETEEKELNVRLPRIMSPTKPRPRWSRTLDDDEILLEFDSVISEVLPSPETTRTTTTTTTTNSTTKSTARRCLSYPISESKEEPEEEQEADWSDHKESHMKISHQAAIQLNNLRLPQGLSISLG